MPPIDRIRGGGASWLDDGSAFFYSRLALDWEKRPRAERFMDNTVYLRRLAEPGKDVAVFGPTVHPELGLDRSDGASELVTPQLHGSGAAGVAELAGKVRDGRVVERADDVIAGRQSLRGNPDGSAASGLLRRYAPRNDG